MHANWIPKVARLLAGAFSWQATGGYADYVDRDAERMARELELIRMRFPHHA